MRMKIPPNDNDLSMGLKAKKRQLIQHLVEEGCSISQIARAQKLCLFLAAAESSSTETVERWNFVTRKNTEIVRRIPNPWVSSDLRIAYGLYVNHKRVYRIMKEKGYAST